jgi:hypothetical protein
MADNYARMQAVAPKTTTHAAFTFYAGDDWEILATVFDENGAPFDLTGAEILWTLNDGTGTPVFQDGDVTISVVDAATGTCSIVIPADKSTAVAGGKYTDALRIITTDATSTLGVGAIYVTADPFAVPAVAAAAVAPPVRRLRLLA